MEKSWKEEEQHQEDGSQDERTDNDQYKDKFDPSSNEVIVKGLSFKAGGDDVRDFFS